MDAGKLKATVRARIDAERPRLVTLARQIHANPEPGFRETRASGWLTGYLEEKGFAVERGICRLRTAFRASYGQGAPVIALIAEYDALPGVGHACGHNISGVASVGAAVACREVVDRTGGQVCVIGTPAEELYGGKVLMVKRGAFKGVDAAMMAHAGTANTATTYALACQNINVEFFGKSAHAAARPEQGINALEAMLLSFNGINSLRQHIRSSARIHGIITDGGRAPNVVPDHAAGSFIVRAEDDRYLDELKARVLACFRAAATATGARLRYRWDPVRYAPMKNNLTIARLFAANLESLGQPVALTNAGGALGSTDMGNVSQVAPAIHATVAIAPPGTLLHSPEFAAAAATDAAMDGLCHAARALAMTVVDLLAEPKNLAQAREEFKEEMG